MKEKLQEEFNFYVTNQDELLKKYNGKYLVIIGKEVLGAFDTFEIAYSEASQKHKPGSFLIQFCSPGSEDYSYTFYSNVAFG